MSRLVPLLAGFGCLAVAFAAEAQTPRPQASRAAKPTPASSAAATAPAASAPANRPQFRPAVLVTGPDSLINRIDVKDLLAKGQKDGAVQFSVVVDRDGKTADPTTYHALENCQALESEVAKQLGNARFTPPIYQHQAVSVLLYGTVLFDAATPPHLRIVLNQDPSEIEARSDFIGPQPVIGGDSKFRGLEAVQDMPVKLIGVVNVGVRVNSKGEMEGFGVASEEPPLLGLADVATSDLMGAKFIPGFRDGDITDSATLVSLCYTPNDEEDTGTKLELKPPPEPGS